MISEMYLTCVRATPCFPWFTILFFPSLYDARGPAVVLQLAWLAVLRFVTVLALIIRACARELSRRGRKSEEPKLKSIPRPVHRRELAWLSALNARRRGRVFTEHRGNHNLENTRAPRRGVYHGESPSRRRGGSSSYASRKITSALPCRSRQVHATASGVISNLNATFLFHGAWRSVATEIATARKDEVVEEIFIFEKSSRRIYRSSVSLRFLCFLYQAYVFSYYTLLRWYRKSIFFIDKYYICYVYISNF